MASLKLFTFAALLGMITACSLTNRTPIIVEETTPESRPIVYYYFASGDDFPAGSVVILADSLVLSPTAIPGSADVAANLQAALQAASLIRAMLGRAMISPSPALPSTT